MCALQWTDELPGVSIKTQAGDKEGKIMDGWKYIALCAGDIDFKHDKCFLLGPDLQPPLACTRLQVFTDTKAWFYLKLHFLHKPGKRKCLVNSFL